MIPLLKNRMTIITYLSRLWPLMITLGALLRFIALNLSGAMQGTALLNSSMTEVSKV